MPELEIQESDPLRITNVELDDNGWYTAQTDGQPKKLSTNREPQGREMGRFKTDGVLIKVNYVHRQKPNPQGGFFNNYYYYGGTPVTETASNGDDGITRTVATRPQTAPDEAWRIALSVGSERAVALAPHLPRQQADFPFIWALSYEFARRIYLTPLPDPNSLEPLPGTSPGAYSDPTMPDDSDDIPF
jgi:hypothetical protein